MEITKYISKKTMVHICIIIVILIILRILYSIYYKNEYIEGFDLSNNAASDLLTKYKSNEAQDIVDSSNKNIEMQIYSWSNKLYNMQNPTSLTKAIAFYKPNLTINKVQYAKLGDIVCQNTDYSLPTHDQFTLLIKKGTSDIKPPVRFDLMSEIVNPNFNQKYYEYSKYIDNSSDFSSIAPNINRCSAVISNLNALIQNNLSIINAEISKIIIDSYYIRLPGSNNSLTSYKMTDFMNKLSKGKHVVNGPFTTAPSLELPAGIEGYVIINGQQLAISIPSRLDSMSDSQTKLSNLSNFTNVYENISESDISNDQFKKKLFGLMPIKEIVTFLTNLCDDMESIYNQSQNQTPDLLTYLNLAPSINEVRQIKNNINNSENLINLSSMGIMPSLTSSTSLIYLVLYIITTAEITYNATMVSLKLLEYGSNTVYEGGATATKMVIDTKKSIGGIIPNHRVKTTDIGCYKDSLYDSESGTTLETNRAIPDLLGQRLDGNLSQAIRVQQCADLANQYGYNTIGLQGGVLCYGGFDPDYSKYGPTDNGTCSIAGDGAINRVYKINNDSITITGFDNDIVSNIPSSSYNILTNSTFDSNQISIINSILLNVTKFSGFTGDFANNSMGYFPLQIYKPIAPDNYTSLGHVFCNITTDLQKIISSNNVACVPSHCVKEIRDWTANDKIFEYQKNGKYFAIYVNPYTGTFMSTNINAQQLPEGKVCKVVACVKKCTAVEELEKADDCARKYYNMNKQSITSTPLGSTLVSNQEEEFYLDKIKVQSDSITRLKQKAQQMQTDIDKANIVNREMNKSKLQNYVDVQKRNIDIIMKRLQEDKNKIKTDINIPSETLKDLIQMIKNSLLLSSQQKTDLLKKLTNSQNLSDSDYNKNLNQILSSCPQYDLSGLVSKQTASDVCFGCDTPK